MALQVKYPVAKLETRIGVFLLGLDRADRCDNPIHLLAEVPMFHGFSWLAAASLASFGARGDAAETPTFHRDIAPILRRHCQECHRPGQVAPFSLLSYDQARKRAADLARVTRERLMPPWPASTDEGGPFRDARTMSAAEIDMLMAWSEAGAPEGNESEAPPPLQFASEWSLGVPDLMLKPEEAYELAARGSDEHRVFVIPSGLSEGRWIQAIDFKPGNPRVVHHVLGAFDTQGNARKLDRLDAKPGYGTFSGFGIIPAGELDGWAPGKSPHQLPDGVARYLPAHSDVLIQVHYHKTGKPERDATAIGLYFAKSPVQKQLRAVAVMPPRRGVLALRPDLAIPPGDDNYEVHASRVIGQDSHAVAVIPHMHWLGKDFRMTATYPDGITRTLIRIDRWNFNWQATYDFEQPLALPAGTRLDVWAHFDNSAANPANPNKQLRTVRWGEQTDDEMCIGFLHLTRDKERLDDQPPVSFRDRQAVAPLTREAGLSR